MQIEISVVSDAGGRKVNEDAYGFWTGGGGCFCVVCDGAGGHGGGDVASKLAVSTILSYFQAHQQCTVETIEAALLQAHDAIISQQSGQGRLAEMRATAAVLVIDTVRHVAAWGHVGDTRLYCFREQRVAAQTKDHSVVQRMVDAGYLAPNALRESAQRSRLFAALGHPENHAPTLGERAFPVATGDVFLLCTDGLWEYVDEPGMEKSLADTQSPAAWLRSMETQVVARGGSGGDNFSALAVWCGTAPASADVVAD
jgi:serine/threonine protein phosphatase PrpC